MMYEQKCACCVKASAVISSPPKEKKTKLKTWYPLTEIEHSVCGVIQITREDEEEKQADPKLW